MLSNSDPINLIHLAKMGKPTDATYYAGDIMIYLDYMKDLAKLRNQKLIVGDDNFNSAEYDKNIEFFSKFKVNLGRSKKSLYMEEVDLLKLLAKIENDEGDLELTDEEFSFMFGHSTSREEFIKYLNRFNLPKIVRQSRQDNEVYKQLKSFALNDRMFKNYKIVNIYEIIGEKKDFSKYAHCTRGIHGTKNASLLSILNSGFVKPSDLRKSRNEYRMSGQALGDGVYFARPEQISKSLAYTDGEFSTSYMIVADLYYDNVQHTDEFKTFKYNGKNLVHAHSVGQYNRDELVVSPCQIDIKYVIEIERR